MPAASAVLCLCSAASAAPWVAPLAAPPLGGPAAMLAVVAVLAVVFLLLRWHLRRSFDRQAAAPQYRPKRFETTEPAGEQEAEAYVPISGAAIKPTDAQRVVRVDLGKRSYDVLIGPGAMKRLGEAAAALGSVRQAVVIADSTVAELYGRAATDSLAAGGVTATLIDFPAGEEHKTLSTYGAVMDELLAVEPAIDRDSLIVALGGGVAGDLAGFVAATALRGLRWIACPSTLLADVDASVGGKTAVDHPSGKNLIGAFHQPRAVLIDTSVLATLDARELRSGLAECVKHGMIRDERLLDFIAANAAAILAVKEDVMTELVTRNVAIKAAVVSADERESSVRSHLNFGHTVGHAVETHLGLGKITHGQAVSLGMVAACEIAVRRGLIDAAYAGRLKDLLAALHLPVAIKGLDAAAIWGIIQHDKKARAGRIRMILPTGPGQVAIFDDIGLGEVIESLAETDTL